MRWRRPCWLAALILLLSVAQARAETLLLGLQINGEDSGMVIVAVVEDERLLLDRGALLQAGFLIEELPHEERSGQSFVAADAIDGATWEIDRQDAVLRFACPSRCFAGSFVTLDTPAPPTDPGVFGLFLNYDVFAELSDPGGLRLAAGVEMGLSTRWGSAVNSLAATTGDDDSKLVRLATTWITDDPQTTQRLLLGDGITRTLDYGRPGRFGGVQFGRDFSLRPYFITFPSPELTASAALPSTVEVFVDGALTDRREVDPGPLVFDDLPVTQGSGVAQVVVTDVLGRSDIVTLPFYAATDLLKIGLDDYTMEAGALRRDFGSHSFDYYRPFAAGTYRLGTTDWLTLESHAETSTAGHGLGGGVIVGVGQFGQVEFLAAGSLSRGEFGGLAQAGYFYDSDLLTLRISVQGTTRSYWELTLEDDELAPRWDTAAGVGLNLGDYGAINIAGSYRDARTDHDEDILLGTAGYNVTLWDVAFLSVTATQIVRPEDEFFAGIFIVVPLGTRERTTLSLDRRDDGLTYRAAYVKTADIPEGFGYRGAVSLGERRRFEVGATAETLIGTAQLDLVKDRDFGTGARLSLLGSAVYQPPTVDLARSLRESYGVVTVGTYEGVKVFRDNQLVGLTDEEGRILVPDLRSYEANQIRIDPLDLPVTVSVDTPVLEVSPPYRSGVEVVYPISGGAEAALLSVTGPDGLPLPSGTRLRAPDGTEFPVGNEGKAYLTGVPAGALLDASVRSGNCQFAMPPHAGATTVIDVRCEAAP